MSRSKSGHIPVRMCIVCRERFPKEELTRLVEGGKGKYVCSKETCRSKVAKRFGLSNEG